MVGPWSGSRLQLREASVVLTAGSPSFLPGDLGSAGLSLMRVPCQNELMPHTNAFLHSHFYNPEFEILLVHLHEHHHHHLQLYVESPNTIS